jgi:hypothetical protein
MIRDSPPGRPQRHRPGAGSMTVAAPAGWPLRHCTVGELVSLLAHRPPLVEISKDFIRDAVSLKELGVAISTLRDGGHVDVAFAGTTDLIDCAGLPWNRYRRYLAVQGAQARFLDCSYFRLFVGEPSASVPMAEVIRRVREACEELAPMATCIEIHAGMESQPAVLAELMRSTPAHVVLDVEGMQRAGLTVEALLRLVPQERVAYLHQRNLPPHWVEHDASLEDEVHLHERFRGWSFLWEPKTVDDPRRIRELFGEYQAASSDAGLPSERPPSER